MRGRSHANLGYSPGLDFETRLLFKPEVAELLEKELRKPGYVARPLALGSNTDPYQPVERTLKLTRAVLQVLDRFNHPVSIVTKSAGVLRDLDILQSLAGRNLVQVHLSVTTLDTALARVMEPRAATPARRLAAVEALSRAGVPAAVLAAPMIPGLNDAELERILEAASRAGARQAGYILLRLPNELKEIFTAWLHAHFPDRAGRVLEMIRETRRGALNDAQIRPALHRHRPLCRHAGPPVQPGGEATGPAGPRRAGVFPLRRAGRRAAGTGTGADVAVLIAAPAGRSRLSRGPRHDTLGRVATIPDPLAMTTPTKLVRARAPLRLGLAGGGTDLSPYCDDYGGAVLNATIGRYAYAFIEAPGDGAVRFLARDLGIEERLACERCAIAGARLAIHAGVYARMMRDYCGGSLMPLTITTYVDAPAGSGLGSSSALAVALVEAFRTLLELPLGLYDVAHLAFEIERIDLRLAGGKQDQYASAFGGANFIEFLAGDRVIVNPLRVARGFICELETSLVTCFTGISRRSEVIIAEQQRRMVTPTAGSMDSLHQLKSDAIEMKQALLRGKIGHVADILNRSWAAKKKTAEGISTGEIERLHAVAMAHGALAGKVSGAGGGGFLMFIVPPQHRVGLIDALNAAGGTASAVHFTADGAEFLGGAGGTRRPGLCPGPARGQWPP